MRKLSNQLQFQAPNFAGQPSNFNSPYQRMIQMGHAHRPDAGAFLQETRRLVTSKRIDDGSIDVLIEAIHRELEGTGQDLPAFEQEVATFFYEFAHLFTDEGKERLREYYPNVQEPAAIDGNQRVNHVPTINGWFQQIAMDGKVSEEEVDQLLAAYQYVGNNATFINNLTTLYGSDKLKLEGDAVSKLREGLGDPAWMKNADVANYVKRAFKKKAGPAEIRVLRKAMSERLGEKYQRKNMAQAFTQALQLAELPARQDLQLTKAGKDALDEFLDGQPAIDRCLNEIKKGDASEEKLHELADAVTWTWGAGRNPNGLADQLNEALGEPYMSHPDIDVELCYALDMALRNQQVAQQRRMVGLCDIFGALDIVYNYNISGETPLEHPVNGSDVTVKSNNQMGIEIEGWIKEGTLVISCNRDAMIMKKDSKGALKACNNKEIDAFVRDEDLGDVVRAHLTDNF